MGNTIDEELIDAARFGNLSEVKELIRKGANVEATNEYGWTALHYASSMGRLEVVKCLVEQGKANVEATEEYGGTSLHKASDYGHLEVVKYLVEQGKANVEATDDDERTALHKASLSGQLEVVKYLVEQGKANVEATDRYGRTTLKLAKTKGRSKVVEYLKIYKRSPTLVGDNISGPSSTSSAATQQKDDSNGVMPNTSDEHQQNRLVKKYKFRADIDFEMEKLQAILDHGRLDHATAGDVEAAIEAKKSNDALAELSKLEQYRPVEDLKKDLERLVQQRKAATSFELILPLAEMIDSIKKRMQGEIEHANLLRKPKEISDSSDKLYKAWRAEGCVPAVPELSPSFLKASTKQFHTDNLLGSGGFGDVYLGFDPCHGIEFAIKRHKKEHMEQLTSHNAAREQIVREIQVSLTTEGPPARMYHYYRLFNYLTD